MSQARSEFSSVWIFVLAAVGSAAGLGNLWRFPYLAYEHGGAAFFLAYVICLLAIGLPLLILEVGLGKISKKGAPGALATIGKNSSFRVLGWFVTCVAFAILTYYVVISSWVLNYATNSFNMPWSADAEKYFFNSFLGLSGGISSVGSMNAPVLFGVIAILILIFFSIYRGTKGLAFVAKWITPIPFILLVVLLINSLNLSGSENGLHVLFVPVWPSLLEPKLWFDAANQVVFSISLATGAMFAYGALLNKSVNVARTCTYVIIGDTLASILCSMIVFSVLGHFALVDGKDIYDVVSGGIGLAFVVIPQSLALLPTAQGFFSFIFYASVFFLAFTSVISLFESILASLMDSRLKLKRTSLLIVVCVVLFIFNLLYTMGNGLYMLDIVDHYVNGYIMLIIMLAEALIIGWMYNINDLSKQLFTNSRPILHSLFRGLVCVIIPIMVGILIVIQLVTDFTKAYGGYPVAYLVVIAVIIVALFVIVANVLNRKLQA